MPFNSARTGGKRTCWVAGAVETLNVPEKVHRPWSELVRSVISPKSTANTAWNSSSALRIIPVPYPIWFKLLLDILIKICYIIAKYFV